MNGWAFYNDQASVLCTDPALCALVDGPVGTPLGSGSAELTASSSAQGNALILPGYNGIRFDRITQLRYSTYRQSADNGNNLAIALQFAVDYDLADQFVGYQGRIVFEPYQGNSGNVLQGAWQNWNAMAGKWWGTKATVTRAGLQVANPCVQATPCTWGNLLATFPDMGVHSTYGAVVLKAGSGWTGFRGNVDDLAIGVDGQTTTFDFERVAPSVRFPLTILAPLELTNGPLPKDSLYTAGTTVEYSFHRTNDGRALRVYLDSIPVSDSGTIVMNGEHVIVAFLEDTMPLTGSDLSLYNSLRSVITSSDPVLAFQSAIDAMAIYRSQNQHSDERIAVIRRRAIDWVSDSTDLVRIDHALGGHVFHVTAPPVEEFARMARPTQLSRSRIPGRATSSIDPPRAPRADSTAIIYVNGAGNTPDDALDTYIKLAEVLRTQRYLNEPEIKVDYVYNESIANYLSDSVSVTARCIRAARPTNDTYESVVKWASCLHLPFRKALLIADFWEAFQQLHQLNNLGQVLQDRDVTVLGDVMRAYQDAGRNVVVVPHSQGNLVTNGAINYLASSGLLRLRGNQGCVAVVPLASMITDYSPVDPLYLKPILLDGDGILRTPDGTFSTPWRTALNDSLKNDRANIFLLSPERAFRVITDAVKMHSMNSYLDDRGGKSLVVGAITKAYQACAVGTVDVQPLTPFDSLKWGTSAAFHETTTNGAGDTLTKAPFWFGYGDGITVSSTGTATAISSIYSGVIVARVGAQEGYYSIRTWGDGPTVASVTATTAIMSVEQNWVNYRTLITANIAAGAGPIHHCNFGTHDEVHPELMGEPSIADGYSGPPGNGEYQFSQTTCSYPYYYRLQRSVYGPLYTQLRPASFYVIAVDAGGKTGMKFGKFPESPEP
ncbi:MAG: hypothetical protein ABJE10_08690 [bacterium]